MSISDFRNGYGSESERSFGKYLKAEVVVRGIGGCGCRRSFTLQIVRKIRCWLDRRGSIEFAFGSPRSRAMKLRPMPQVSSVRPIVKLKSSGKTKWLFHGKSLDVVLRCSSRDIFLALASVQRHTSAVPLGSHRRH